MFPRLRDIYEAILLNSGIPEPANIEFYEKYLSGEDFCYFLRFDDIMAGPREGAGDRTSSHMRTGSLQGQLGRNFMCILVALKVYGCYILKANV